MQGEVAWRRARGTSSNSFSIRMSVPFFDPVSRQLLRDFWCSKWVIRGTVGNLGKSTFQIYKFCTNRSTDKKVMALGSRGVRAVFLLFSGEDSSQTGDVTGKPRVACRSQSYSLS
jgi:hypothetical protein